MGLHLQLLPVLLGFFTYKGAVIARGALDLFAGLSSAPVVAPLPAEGRAREQDSLTPTAARSDQ